MFVALLHKEASLVSLQILLVSERKLKRMQRSTYRKVQRRLRLQTLGGIQQEEEVTEAAA